MGDLKIIGDETLEVGVKNGLQILHAWGVQFFSFYLQKGKKNIKVVVYKDDTFESALARNQPNFQ
ncbi:hypothetical protein GW943_00500 [Candidatus Parcubacteria bacterium]|uniref:Uncharacterized protein n=1 Tax=Candidatus Kaiserbacteria bacterium CG10_big_fil_rev_8_21_14_0_10_47_16 TaxID=1974608 RepID=A0A2H0UD24_9BACT|nr:hypothetical protein [Candidatus Parcubacteria bacterium]PIR84324.1 MAG: hypothetical protein COU16_01880 [Candidatus Kaiserbacteria bacterium CG10_big_fil_rev_8_21_14_0_10_47_16]